MSLDRAPSEPIKTASTQTPRAWEKIQSLSGKTSQGGLHRQVQCPAHDDRQASLSATLVTGPEMKVLVKCHAGCDTKQDVLPAWGMTWSDLFPPQVPVPTLSRGRVVKEYIYKRLDHSVNFKVSRKEPKGFFQSRPDGQGGWIPGMDGVERTLYRLDEFGGKGYAIFVEGEKDVDALYDLGLRATTTAGGAAKSWEPQYTDQLKAVGITRIFVIPDNDVAGRKYMDTIGSACHAAGLEVKTVELPDLPDKGDTSDWIASGGTKKKLEELLKVAPIWEPAGEPEPQADQWPALQPLPDAMPAAPMLTRDMLPPALSGFVFDIAHRMSCAVDYPAVAALIALATVVGRKVTIKPKRHDNWTVVPNLWGLIIGPPGVLKSPAQHAAFRFLYDLADQAREQHGQDMLAHEQAMTVYNDELARVKEEKKAAGKDKAAAGAVQERIAALKKPDEPKAVRYLTNDATVEKLGQMLVDNTNGLLIERDEMTGLFAQMEMKGHEQDRSFYLEAWEGHRGKAIDRIGRGSLWVPHCVLSMIGTIQPGPLAAYLDRFYGEGRTDGFIERFQLAVYPEVTEWTDVDEAPDQKAADRAALVFSRAHALAGPGEHELSFDQAAQELFTSWRAALERRARDERIHPVLRSHLAKYRSLMPALAVLFQLALSRTITEVGAPATRLAVRWCEYLEGHARRMLWPVIQTDEVSTVLRLARKLPGLVGEEFTARDIKRKDWSGLTESSVIEEALRALEALGWVRGARVTYGRGGRETTKWTVNPAITVGNVSVGCRELRFEISREDLTSTSSSSRKQDSSRTDTDSTDTDPSSDFEEADEPPF